MNKKIKQSKKGFLLASEVLKIVLAVISISFLIYLLFSLYYSNSNAKNKEEAQSTINRINDIITRINNNAVKSEGVTDITPVSWSFFSYIGSESKPNLCAGETCLCICDTPNVISKFWTSQTAKCDSDGVCLAVSNLQKFQSFEIKSPSDGGTSVNITKNGEYIGVEKL